MQSILRHRTALVRSDLSRPVRLALADGMLRPGMTLMDYGCGRGGDVARLRQDGFDCTGWDPVHAPDGPRRKADVVNIGYVVNVIENPIERREALQAAWSLAAGVLVVSARLIDETPVRNTKRLADGVVTRLSTFQKFYDQQELRNWIDQSLQTQSVPAAPGVFYVFRHADERAAFMAGRFRRRSPRPRMRLGERLATEHRELLDSLAEFLSEYGRLPSEDELESYGRIVDALGSLQRAQRLLLTVSDAAAWELVRRARREDLLVYLALARFDGRPRFGELPVALQRDVKAFFGPYTRACAEADALLFSLGRPDQLNAAAATAPIGKLLPTALYLHTDALTEAPLLIRLYEGCARAIVGQVETANVLKLRRDEPKVSYLTYPGFSTDPHPVLTESLSVHLQTFRMKTRHYGDSHNPPILHRKDALLPIAHPWRGKFARLTRQEERAGLLSDTSKIGNRDGWMIALHQSGYTLVGHQLRRRT